MKRFKVTGMSCAACQARVWKAVSELEGVRNCSVNLLTNSMDVEGEASASEIIKAVERAGYGAEEGVTSEEMLADTETPVLRKRLITSLILLIVLMYFSMAHSMWGAVIPGVFEENETALGIFQMSITVLIMIINRKFFISGFKSLFHGGPNMDTLVALGASASFLWSIWLMADGNGKSLYFDSAAMILTLITVGKFLEAKSKGKTTDAIRSLMELAPEYASVIEDGAEKLIPAKDVKIGDIFVVRSGESIPADGNIIEGNAAVDESALTGESMPVDKGYGDSVSAATVNRSGFIRCRATRVGDDTALAKIISMVADAASGKAPIARIADKVSGVFVPVVVAIAIITLGIWLILGKNFDYALARSISVLVISCPCALGLATPVAVMAGSGKGAGAGILFKSAQILEEAGKVKIAVLDKTGTLTRGEPFVAEILPGGEVSEEELLSLAYSVEIKSEHPLAKAIVNEAEKRGLKPLETEKFRVLQGGGVSAEIDGKLVIGKAADMSDERASMHAERGMTPVMFTENDRYLGILAISDRLKDDAAEGVSEMKNMGIRVVMLTGDNEKTAGIIASQAGIDHVVAGVLPDEKDNVVSRLKSLGKVAMAGDGINDAPALTSADIGIAVGSGTDVAIDAADIVLMNSGVSDIASAIRLSRKVLRNIHENLFWAFFYNALCIPLAAGCYTALLGWELNPMIAAAAMSLSSLCVVSNALRLNLFEMRSAKNDKRIKDELSDEQIQSVLDEIDEMIKKEKEKKTMEKIMKIEGMMCIHCEAHTRKALEAIDGVESAEPSHVEGKAVLKLSKDVDDEVLKAAVTEAGYEVTGIEYRAIAKS